MHSYDCAYEPKDKTLERNKIYPYWSEALSKSRQRASACHNQHVEYSICCESCFMLPNKSSTRTLNCCQKNSSMSQGYINYNLFFHSNDKGSLHTFTDADWAGNTDSGCSTSRILYKFGTSPIAWSNKFQPTIALSSIEAEYKASAIGSRTQHHLFTMPFLRTTDWRLFSNTYTMRQR